MTPHNLKIWAMINSIMARIEGMKAENQDRLEKGFSVAYTEEAFFSLSYEIELFSQQIES